jgi:hypothetical protein
MSETIIFKLIDTFPQAAAEKDFEDGCYPIHDACCHRQTEAVVLKLIEVSPQACKEANENFNYPLNYAFRYGYSEKVVLKLLDTFPQITQEKDRFGTYLLHQRLELYSDRSDTVILKIMESFPQAVKEKNTDGEYPLSIACSFQHSDAVVLQLINDFPQAIREKNRHGHYPLNVACLNNLSENIVFKLLTEFPQAAKHNNALLFALHSHRSEKVIFALLDQNLLSLSQKEVRVALLVAKEHCKSSTVLQVLDELSAKSDYELQNHIGIPTIITINGLDNLRRCDTFEWLQLLLLPILIDGKYIERK